MDQQQKNTILTNFSQALSKQLKGYISDPISEDIQDAYKEECEKLLSKLSGLDIKVSAKFV